MSWIAASDPLALVAIAAGQVPTPASETGAAGGGKLDTQQRAVELGEPVPIVFGRRRNSKGGVLISPGATEARFENDTSNNVTVWYHLVLSEGQIDSIPVKDVFQRSCRVGSHSQTYNRRAGTWTPGNAIVAREGYDMPECPYYCGTRGAYPGMSTLSFTNTIPDGFDQWNRQVHCFIRGGMRVTRLYDSVSGPSDSFADLVLWMLTNSGRVPSALIDTTALTAADLFLEENGFTCNCWITESQNYGDLLAKWAPYFLLGESNNGGKKGLRPLLPVTNTGAIDTGAISWKYAFNEDTILPGSLEIQYTSLADRLAFVAQITWRQQLEDDFGIIRTAEVRYSGTAESGPYESHDLSAFCTSENHAVKVGAYLLAKRVYTTHTIRFSARPQAHNTLLSPGDIIRVTLDRTATAAAPSQHDYLYQVERISKTLAGDVSYECTHFPVDSQGRSLVALDVAAAQGTGILLSSNKTGVGCDVNSSSNNTIPAETWSAADNLGINETLLGSRGSARPEGSDPIEDDELDGSVRPDISVPAEGAYAGGTLSAPSICAGATYEWVRSDTPIAGAQAATYTTGPDDVGERVYAVISCPDGLEYATQGETVFNPEYRFPEELPLIEVYYSQVIRGYQIIGCNTEAPLAIPNNSSGSSSVTIAGATSVKAVTLVTNPGSSTVIGYNSASSTYSVSCGALPYWVNANKAIIGTKNGQVVDIAYLGGGSFYTEGSSTYLLRHSVIITNIVLLSGVQGIGPAGTDVTNIARQWYTTSSEAKDYGFTVEV